MQSDDRLQKIKVKVREERKLLSKLERTLINPDLKQLLKPALHALDDVEGYFLDPKVIGNPPRTSPKWQNGLADQRECFTGPCYPASGQKRF
jgi:hypothetical protein